MLEVRGWRLGLVVLSAACGGADPDGPGEPPLHGGRDPNPVIGFTQEAEAVGIDRSNEPASAGPFSSTDTLAYGGWLVDLDGDGQLDYYGVNHAQWPHLSGLFLNNGAGGFGQNLFTVALQPSQASFPNMGTSNEMKFIADLTGDGRPDLYFMGWSGQGVLCAYEGAKQGPDWSGPGYRCFGTTDALTFDDVNGDGRLDVLALDDAGFDTYTAYYSHTGRYVWRLNDGTPNLNQWPTATSFLDLRVTAPSMPSAPFVDLDGDRIPDKIEGIPLAESARGTYATKTGGKRVFLGRASGYVLQSGTGLEAVKDPITAIEDINEDGCLDIGTDETGYRDNQSWYVQKKSGDACSVTFTATARTALPYFPGFKRYDVDIDNSGLLSKVVLIHGGYGHADGQPVGASIYRKLPDGGYTQLRPDQHGIRITGAEASEFYADNLSPGDWNDDGLPDLAGTGSASIPGTDSGHALWTSKLQTLNGWIKVTLPTVSGFFAGTATLEVFEPGGAGDAARRIGAPRTFTTGRTWASQVHHLGIGTWPKVDVRVTLPDGAEVVRKKVARGERISIP